jgi:sugar (pentulose or hexulose) kinase
MGGALGLELGSTRIKCVIVGEGYQVLQAADVGWENDRRGGYWTYDLSDALKGAAAALAKLKLEAADGAPAVGSLGLSAMMHGYLAFDEKGELLVPFRTWRNTNTGEAAKRLSDLFGLNIPLRWSVAHLYQAILDQEPHAGRVAHLTTLAGWLHWRLTGRKVLGVGDASGMFPIAGGAWDPALVEKFRQLTGLDWTALAPGILLAGQEAGRLTEEGARLLGAPKSFIGLPLCPPEGDAGTGMVATNALAPRSGNVSAGTSVFAMVVLEKPLRTLNEAIDVVTTPDGHDVAMVHYNECTTRIDGWVALFGEALEMFGARADQGELFKGLYEKALGQGPLAQFMRGRLTEAVAELGDGLAQLTRGEGVKIDHLTGHGGYFKSGQAGRVVMSEALGVPVRLMAHASEGGAWGAAALALYLLDGRGATRADYVNSIFAKGGEI